MISKLFFSFFSFSNRPRSILTRRLCRNRKYDDNELYRSNSFRFQRFERGIDDMTARRMNNQVSTEYLMNDILGNVINRPHKSFISIHPPFSSCLLLICNIISPINSLSGDFSKVNWVGYIVIIRIISDILVRVEREKEIGKIAMELI
mgnify:CR=1 FL=1